MPLSAIRDSVNGRRKRTKESEEQQSKIEVRKESHDLLNCVSEYVSKVLFVSTLCQTTIVIHVLF